MWIIVHTKGILFAKTTYYTSHSTWLKLIKIQNEKYLFTERVFICTTFPKFRDDSADCDEFHCIMSCKYFVDESKLYILCKYKQTNIFNFYKIMNDKRIYRKSLNIMTRFWQIDINPDIWPLLASETFLAWIFVINV